MGLHASTTYAERTKGLKREKPMAAFATKGSDTLYGNETVNAKRRTEIGAL